MYIIILIVIAVIIYAFSSGERPDFVLSIREGALSIDKGTISNGIFNDFKIVLKNVKQGKVIGHKSEQGFKLSFQGEISDGMCQRLRNIIGIHQP